MPVIVVGVLALQGAFAEHLEYLAQAAQAPELGRLSFEFVAVRTPQELSQCAALVMPGGESTSMSLIAERTSMLEPLREFARTRPVWGTCAGLILLASEVRNARPHQKTLGAMSICVARNAFGRQLDSFEEPCDFSSFAPGVASFRAVFIRAPVVCGAKLHGAEMVPVGPELAAKCHSGRAANGTTNSHSVTIYADCQNSAPVQVLHSLDSGLVVAVRQGDKLGTSFHPELSGDYRFHGWFLSEFVVGRDREL